MKFLEKITKTWKILENEVLIQASPWITVSKQKLLLPNGKCVNDYYRVSSPSFVEIIPIDSKGNFLAQWRYKHGPKKYNLAFPAGYISEAELPLDAAKRELHEECGIYSNDWTYLGGYYLDGNRSDMMTHLYIAWNPMTSEKMVQSDDLEDITNVWLTPDEILQSIDMGLIIMLSSRLAIEMALNKISKIKNAIN